MVLPTTEEVALRVAAEIAAAARAAVQARGRFLMAVSGGSSPIRMFELLADEDVPWGAVELFQVDERVVPIEDPARNLAHLQAALLDPLPELPLVHPMPVEQPDLATAAGHYAQALQHHGGTPPVLDLVHLGLGDDGHTASLVPGDPVLAATADVAITASYRGHRRMTLTYPALNRARRVLWLVTSADKAAALARLRAGDAGIPAGRVSRARAILYADAGATGRS